MRKPVQLGIERLLADPEPIRGKRIAVLSHQAAITHDFRRTVDCLAALAGDSFVRIFGPEHGFWGVKQDMEGASSENDSATGIPIESLYAEFLHKPGPDGKTDPGDASADELARWQCSLQKAKSRLKPSPELLADIEVLVVDLQDVGARYYTFANTMAYCMEVARTTGTLVLVLDRPNPINGVAVEGNVLALRYASFVGQFALPARHGMTIGELARFYQTTDPRYACDLEVVAIKGWSRELWWDETDLPWVPPSPNMPSLSTATVYPGMCLIEATEASEGRGTTIPFEIFGAPEVDPFALADRMNAFGLAGVRFRPQFFKPMFQKQPGKLCGGAQLHVTDRDAFHPYLAGLLAVKTLHELWPSFQWRIGSYEYEVPSKLHALEQCVGTPRFRDIVEGGASLEDWTATWEAPLREFQAARDEALLY